MDIYEAVEKCNGNAKADVSFARCIKKNIEEYNGYPNYETWAISLWMDNDRYEYAREMAKEEWEAAEGTPASRIDVAKTNFANNLKWKYEDEAPLAEDANAYTDLLNAALSEVNWYSIAENIMEEMGFEEK